jgi:hypothetical protein
MDITEIVKDAVKYPFSDWKKVLILGIIVMFSTLNYTFQSLGTFQTLGITMILLAISGLFGLIFGLFVSGYEVKILKSSLTGFAKLPEFNNWFDMFIDGIKIFIVDIGYMIPFILIMIFGGVFLGLTAGIMGNNIITIFIVILIITAIFYLIIIIPIVLMALANMAFYDGDLGAAFEVSEIFNKISNIGWVNFIKWYIVTGIVCLILMVIWGLIAAIFNLFSFKIIGVLLTQLILVPYVLIYLYRSAALFYLSESWGYLECEKCGGYYELQPGESPEDFEECECGGNLKFSKVSPLNDKSENIKFEKQSFRENLKSSLNKKRNLMLIGILALIIIAIPLIFTQHMITTNSTLIGSYNVSDLDPDGDGTFVVIPPRTTNIKIEYNLSWTPVRTGTHGMGIAGYNTNVTAESIPIYQKSISLFNNGQNKNGTFYLDNSAIKSLIISKNGVNGTIKIYSYQTKLAI